MANHSSSGKPERAEKVDRFWTPDNSDGSGWAAIDWVSAVRGSQYHYRHGLEYDDALAELPPFYRVVTRLESDILIPHENSYFIPREHLGDFLAEIALAGGIEQVWHVEPCADPPAESRVSQRE
jgi:hypothetical protein